MSRPCGRYGNAGRLLITSPESPDCFDNGVSAEDRFLAELESIDLHHGPYSSTSPYTEIVVMGARLTAEVRAELSEFGFAEFAETQDGFAARRSHEEAMRRHEDGPAQVDSHLG